MALEPLAPSSSPSASEGDAALRSRIGVDVPRRVTASSTVVAPAWVDVEGSVVALLHEDEVQGLVSDEPGTFAPAALPDAVVRLRVGPEAPARRDDSTSWVKFVGEAGRGSLRAGDVGWVTVRTRSHEQLVVPSGAVQQSTDGPFLLARSPDGRTFTRQPVRIGSSRSGATALVSGVGDRIAFATQGAFFVDAERRRNEPPATGTGP
jgi:hypothetical protein